MTRPKRALPTCRHVTSGGVAAPDKVRQSDRALADAKVAEAARLEAEAVARNEDKVRQAKAAHDAAVAEEARIAADDSLRG